MKRALSEAPTSAAPRVAEGILDLVGDTPLLHLRRFVPAGAADIYAKCEFLNPGGSVKDRAALGMIDEAEASGRLRPGATIVEPTAGNTGVGPRAGRHQPRLPRHRGGAREVRGPQDRGHARAGAEVILTPTEAGIQGAIAKAKEVAAALPDAFVPQQFENPANPAYHYRTTAAEIHAQLGRFPDALVLGAGTGGTFTGVARYFKEREPRVRAVLVEPQGSVWGGGPAGPHKVEGIGNSFWPGALDRSLVDEIRTIGDGESFAVVKELARTEGLLVGGSSGSAVFAAREVAREMGAGKTVVTVLADGFERYLGKGIFENL
jgi:cysteine synthase